jgi:hypothetical protein
MVRGKSPQTQGETLVKRPAPYMMGSVARDMLSSEVVAMEEAAASAL